MNLSSPAWSAADLQNPAAGATCWDSTPSDGARAAASPAGAAGSTCPPLPSRNTDTNSSFGSAGAVQETLRLVAAQLPQQLQFPLCFDPFGDGGHAESARQHDDGLDQAVPRCTVHRLPDETAIDLQRIDRQRSRAGSVMNSRCRSRRWRSVCRASRSLPSLATSATESSFSTPSVISMSSPQSGVGPGCHRLHEPAFKIGMTQLRRRDVDGDPHRRQSGPHPFQAVLRRLFDHHSTNRHDQTDGFQQRAGTPPASPVHPRAAPAQQRLGAFNPPGGDVHLRLVVELEFAPLQREAQTVLQRQAAHVLGTRAALYSTICWPETRACRSAASAFCTSAMASAPCSGQSAKLERTATGMR